jgi:peptidoglycan/LPS O-acetylase OafA/YrhL
MANSEPAVPQGPAQVTHLRHVEGMRALAALVVFVNHAYAQVWASSGTSEPGTILAPLRYAMVAGHLSVTVFIVISGFCLALPVARNGGLMQGSTLAFIKRRARRILPPYYAALFLSLILIWTIIGEPTGTLWDVPIQVTPTAVISHLLLLQDLFATGSINYVFWSIAVEWQIYFLFPLVIWGFRRLGPWQTVLIALLLGYAVRYGFGDTRVARANPHFIGMFALGVLAAFGATSEHGALAALRSRTKLKISCALPLVAVCAMIVLWDVEESRRNFPVLDLLVGAMTCPALLLTTRFRDAPLTKILASRPLALIGTFSYSLYLIHAPLLQIAWQYALKPAGLGETAMFAVLMTAGLSATLTAAYGFFRLFEAPFMSARARTGRMPKAAPVPAA